MVRESTLINLQRKMALRRPSLTLESGKTTRRAALASKGTLELETTMATGRVEYAVVKVS